MVESRSLILKLLVVHKQSNNTSIHALRTASDSGNFRDAECEGLRSPTPVELYTVRKAADGVKVVPIQGKQNVLPGVACLFR